MHLTVVLPFFNEEQLMPGLSNLLRRILEALAGHEVQLLAIDDGSTDATPEALQAEGGLEVVRHETNRGVGAAMATGMLKAGGEAVLVYDPDEAYAPACLPRLVEALDEADLATLSPYHPGGRVEGVGRLRLLLSRAASGLYRRKLKAPFFTFTCAVRAYRLPVCRELLPVPEDFTAAAYLMAAAVGRGLRVVEVPAVLRARRSGRSKMRLWRTIRSHLQLLRDLPVTASGAKSAP